MACLGEQDSLEVAAFGNTDIYHGACLKERFCLAHRVLGGQCGVLVPSANPLPNVYAADGAAYVLTPIRIQGFGYRRYSKHTPSLANLLYSHLRAAC